MLEEFEFMMKSGNFDPNDPETIKKIKDLKDA